MKRGEREKDSKEDTNEGRKHMNRGRMKRGKDRKLTKKVKEEGEK